MYHYLVFLRKYNKICQLHLFMYSLSASECNNVFYLYFTFRLEKDSRQRINSEEEGEIFKGLKIEKQVL